MLVALAVVILDEAESADRCFHVPPYDRDPVANTDRAHGTDIELAKY
jgi:hypothetical protein